MSALVLTWQIALSLCVLMLSIYSFYQGYLAILSSRSQLKKEGASLKEHPTVVLQIPLFNEGDTIDETFRSILDLTYPKEQLQMQILDDCRGGGAWIQLKLRR